MFSVLEALARADASTAWTVMIGGGSWLDLAGMPRESLDALFSDPDTITAGVFNPSGSITPADGGYRVSGRWSFASGCEHAQWIFGNCIEAGVDGGEPQLRIAVFAPEQVVIEDTWNVSGLCGTGSHHFHVDNVLVPTSRTVVPLGDESVLDDPILRVPMVSLFAMSIASVAVGIAHGALDDIVALATDKVPLLAPASLAANPQFQGELAIADTEFRAARGLLHDVARAAWDMAVAGEPFDNVQRARMRATAVWVTERAAAVVDAAYRAGGGSSLYADCPLQRRLPRRARGHAALPREARHHDHGRRDPRGSGRRARRLLTVTALLDGRPREDSNLRARLRNRPGTVFAERPRVCSCRSAWVASPGAPFCSCS